MCFHRQHRGQERSQLSETYIGPHHPTTWRSPWPLPPGTLCARDAGKDRQGSDTQQTSNLVFALTHHLDTPGQTVSSLPWDPDPQPPLSLLMHRSEAGPTRHPQKRGPRTLTGPGEASSAALSACESFKFNATIPRRQLSAQPCSKEALGNTLFLSRKGPSSCSFSLWAKTLTF